MAKRFAIILVILLLACNLACTFTYIFSTFHSINKEAEEKKNEETQDKKEKEQVALTTVNYYDFIAINASMIDFQPLKEDSSDIYSYYCTIKIETQKNKDVKFSNVVIKLSSGHELKLNTEGYSSISYIDFFTESSISYGTLKSAIRVKEVSGYAIGPGVGQYSTKNKFLNN